MTQIEELLRELRRHLSEADFAQAAALAPALEAALGQIGRPDLATLRRLMGQAERNAALIEAARKGLRAARRRVDEVRRAGLGVQTYDGQGRRADIPVAGRLAGRF